MKNTKTVTKRKKWSQNDFDLMLRMLELNWNRVDYTILKENISELLGASMNSITSHIKSFRLMSQGIEPTKLKGGVGSSFTQVQIDSFKVWSERTTLKKSLHPLMFDQK